MACSCCWPCVPAMSCAAALQQLRAAVGQAQLHTHPTPLRLRSSMHSWIQSLTWRAETWQPCCALSLRGQAFWWTRQPCGGSSCSSAQQSWQGLQERGLAHFTDRALEARPNCQCAAQRTRWTWSATTWPGQASWWSPASRPALRWQPGPARASATWACSTRSTRQGSRPPTGATSSLWPAPTGAPLSRAARSLSGVRVWGSGLRAQRAGLRGFSHMGVQHPVNTPGFPASCGRNFVTMAGTNRGSPVTCGPPALWGQGPGLRAQRSRSRSAGSVPSRACACAGCCRKTAGLGAHVVRGLPTHMCTEHARALLT